MEISYISYGPFTLTETETETNKMATIPNDISVSVQYEHLHTILLQAIFFRRQSLLV